MVELDNTLVHQLQRHLDEASKRAEEIVQLRESNKNIVRSLASGDNKFNELYNETKDTNKNVIKLLHTVNGNGMPGLCQKVELSLERIVGIEKSIITRNSQCTEHLKETSELKQTNKKHEEVLLQLTGIMKLLRWISYIFGSGCLLWVLRQIITIFAK